jgi:pimeloyl-ACP methyl ester carboxylesterase
MASPSEYIYFRLSRPLLIGIALLPLSLSFSINAANTQPSKQRIPYSLKSNSENQIQLSVKSAQSEILVNLKRASLFTEWKNTSRRKNSGRNNHNRATKIHGQQTLIAILNQPHKDKVSNIVFISAGQQTTDPRNFNNPVNGYPNVLTGQNRHYKYACKNKNHCTARLKNGSMASKIYRNSQDFPHSSTLIILVFDPDFGYLASRRKKHLTENSFWNFITARASKNNLASITLMGQSRGGCLAFSLAKKFLAHPDYRHLPTIVQGYEAVCQPGELMQEDAEYYLDNPLKRNPKYKSLKVDMSRAFPLANRDQLAILNIHSGAPVISISQNIGFIHSFSFKPNNIDLGWWKQTWVDFEHTDMGGNLDHSAYTVTPGYRHLLKYRRKFSNNRQ